MTSPESDTPRVFGYARASTKRQVDSPEIQQESMKKYGAMLDLPALTFFVDAAKSGKIPWEERDAGRELFRQLRAGDHIVIAKLDRAFRKLSDCVLVLEKLERMGVKLHICNLLGGAIDLSSPMDDSSSTSSPRSRSWSGPSSRNAPRTAWSARRSAGLPTRGIRDTASAGSNVRSAASPRKSRSATTTSGP